MIIIPAQGGTYRHLRGRVTRLLAESGQNKIKSKRRKGASKYSNVEGVTMCERTSSQEKCGNRANRLLRFI